MTKLSEKQKAELEFFSKDLRYDYKLGRYAHLERDCQKIMDMSPLRNSVFLEAVGFFANRDTSFIKVAEVINDFIDEVRNEVLGEK